MVPKHDLQMLDVHRPGLHIPDRSTNHYRHEFSAIGCRHTVLATDPEVIGQAGRMAEGFVAELDLAASRFRADSQLRQLTTAAATSRTRAVVSPLLGGCVEAALHAARITDGLVDPTVGRAVSAAGYDVDLATVRSRGPSEWSRFPVAFADPSVTVVPGWRSVDYHPGDRILTLPRGAQLDLGATAKAHAADRIAAALAHALPGGFLVNLGGDIAVAGQLPEGGWPIDVEDHRGAVRQVVVTEGQGIATSSTALRQWTVRGNTRHHIVDPRTGQVAQAVWSQVTCAAATALEANAASTAAIVLGRAAPGWLAQRGIPARLDPAVSTGAGSPSYTPGWPLPQRRAA